MLSFKRIARTRWVQKTIGVVAAEYLRLVYWTSRLVTEPADIYERVDPDLPVILAMWHGQHFMAPFIKRPHLPAKTLISRHRDGEMNAIAAEWLGVETIRGSGDHGNGFHRKGGVSAYREMLQALERRIQRGADRRRSESRRASQVPASCGWRAIPDGRFIRWRWRRAAASRSTTGTAR